MRAASILLTNKILQKRPRSYFLGEHSYGNPHGNPLEAEVMLIHGYISDLTCVLFHQINDPDTKAIEDGLKEKAAKMKEEVVR